jgi:hypothetical protein
MEEKMARICWNSNNWRKPSGKSGKSTDISSYEYTYGFGHEEWLFNLDKIIDGYHYGAIQPIGKHQDMYTGRHFKVLLYTYKADAKDWYWVGWLNDVEVISRDEAEKIYNEYKKCGWLEEMKKELLEVNANASELNAFSNFVFNIKFSPNTIIPFSNGLQLFESNQRISHNRYTLLNFDSNILSLVNQNIEIIGNKNHIEHKETITKSFKEYSKEYEFTHGLIQDSFFNYLKQNFPNEKICKEAQITKLNLSIDIYQEKTSGNNIIYEIKTYVDLQYSIRIALGQLLEYGYYPNRTILYKLVVVSNKIITDDVKQYIENLMKLFNLNLGVINYDHISGKIIEEYNCSGCDFAKMPLNGL